MGLKGNIVRTKAFDGRYATASAVPFGKMTRRCHFCAKLTSQKREER